MMQIKCFELSSMWEEAILVRLGLGRKADYFPVATGPMWRGAWPSTTRQNICPRASSPSRSEGRAKQQNQMDLRAGLSWLMCFFSNKLTCLKV